MDEPERLSDVLSEVVLWLCPVRPRTVASTAGTRRLATPVLERWGVREVGAGADLAVRGPDSFLTLEIPATAGGTRHAGGLALDVRVGEDGDARVVEARRARSPVRDRSGRSGRVVVGGGATLPAVVTAARPGAAWLHATVSPRARRRALFVVKDEGRRLVVKSAVGESGARRAGPELQTLVSIRGMGLGLVIPFPESYGEADGVHWSVETAVPGRPMSQAHAPWWRFHSRHVIEGLAGWLTELSARTAHDAQLPLHERTGALVPSAREWLGPVGGVLARSPAVLGHGDLATGGNVLVHRRRFSIIDWETAVTTALPLADLLPLVAWSLARRRRLVGAAAEAAFVVDLCAGRVDESEVLFGLVRRHLSRLGVPVERAGPLAAAAWARSGSMRAQHEAMLRRAGEVPAPWTSMSELVLARWMADPQMGLRWPALTRTTS